ncbi:hypothetical protein BD780_002822 [Clostridium tetanomorphum]|uniref:Uncharacterized protein n=1 Tax=Clostridium tetanomorphum TaxID=1553 RepID=A0A923J1G6_CLOTT|nr:hypothetical protein [Clostridium tetanomorphum]KAJ53829.1 hypothetical protein CTM_01130 [Clostridium tetanomorphum DSM 665]MBC2397343.1 hypothetical protein [Clostridium tetanomorphum]MBP1862562.1 hypothetical protein [Clostridium tetanomorphum]NRS85597.1 hypothetical protein [Clostridium tetanomorphum]NRZ96392.1 hypothetical protein [Clostridium tetanomorphum]
MIHFNHKELEILDSQNFAKYIKNINDTFSYNNQLDFLQVRSIVLIAVNKDIYFKCKDNIVRLLMLLAITSLDNGKNYNFTTEEVMERISIIVKYFKIKSPEIINNTVYFKPDMTKIEKLLEKAKNGIKVGKEENIIFKI